MKIFRTVLIVFFILIIITLIVSILKSRGYWITYQVTPSMPKGFYFVRPVKQLQSGNIAVFSPPSAILKLMLKHHWIPDDGLMMKYVFAVPGDNVCLREHQVWINGRVMAKIFQDYEPGKSLPHAHFCGQLAKGQYLLMSTQVAHSFDGRYFGPIDEQNIVGKAEKL